MKICYLGNAASVHTQRWAKYFAYAGHEVTVVSFQQGQIEGVRVFELFTTNNRIVNIIRNLCKARAVVNRISPDILHAHYVTSYGFVAALLSRHPLIITAWGSDVLVMPKRWLYRKIVRFALKRADLVTSMADHMTQLLTNEGHVTADKVITLPFGVDTSIFNLQQRTWERGSAAPLVVSTRRLAEGLDVHLFPIAIAKVLKAWPNCRFAMAGGGHLKSEIIRLSNELGLGEVIKMVEEINHPEMSQLLGGTDIFVSTSPTDGNNISLNEAMACGAFPIATDIPANRAWIKSGDNGLLFPCGDAEALADCIIEALKRPNWRRSLIASNYKIIERRACWQNEMSKMKKLYSDLLQ